VQPDAFEFVDISDLCKTVPVIAVAPIMTRFSDALADDDLAKVNEHQLDVALRFGFRILKGKVLDVARYGVWSYHHDDSLIYRGGPPGFWEVMKDDPVTGSMLQILTEDLDNGNVIYRSWAPTINRFSVKQNNNNYYWKSAAFVCRKLKELHRDRTAFVSNKPLDSIPHPYSGRLYVVPHNGEMFGLLLNLFRRASNRTFQKLTQSETWSLAYRFKNNDKDTNDSLHRYKYLVPPKHHFWADPFPVKVAGRYFVFFEDFSSIDRKGVIAMMELRKDGSTDAPVKVLEREFHLSYPFLFEWQNSLYMIPETGSNNTVELYRCNSFPLNWAKQTTLLEGNNPSDATLVQHDGRWWMFVSIQEPGVSANWDETYLFHADTPLGPWAPHAHNPVKSDVRNSRPAGRFFYHRGQLMRPAQDCSTRYGYAIAINRVLKLTVEEYREEEVVKILPHWDRHVVGTHTFNSADELTMVDCLIKRRRLFQPTNVHRRDFQS
jgi:hypothetical protein